MTASKQNTAQHPKRYHHGNLRDALIIAAAQLIEEHASVDFAIVDAARRAGVSNAAPYRHFKDKHALLEAVSELGFLGLTETANQALEAANIYHGAARDLAESARAPLAGACSW